MAPSVRRSGPRRLRRRPFARRLPRLWPRGRAGRRGLSLGGRPVDGHVGVLFEDAELAQPSEPARRVAGDQQGLVVDLGVAVGPVVAEHGEDHPRQLVCRGDDGALVAPARGDGAVVGVELAATVPSLIERPVRWP